MLAALARPGSWRFTLTDLDGDPVTPSSSPTVTVVDAAGTAVVTDAAVSAGEGDGVYLYALPDEVVGTLGRYTATATYTAGINAGMVVEDIDVRGELLFDVPDLRLFDKDFSASPKWPGWRIREARDTATGILENAGEVAFATRRTRATIPGTNLSRLLLPDVMVTRIVAVELDGVAMSEGDVADLRVDTDAGMVVNPSGPWPGRSSDVTVTYDHGYTVRPGQAKVAAMTVAKEVLLERLAPARATSQSNSLGDFRITTANPDKGRDTGIPDVDAFLALFGRKRPHIGRPPRG